MALEKETKEEMKNSAQEDSDKETPSPRELPQKSKSNRNF